MFKQIFIMKLKHLTYFTVLFLFITNSYKLFANNVIDGNENIKVFTSHFENVMGTSFEMKLKTNSAYKVTKAENIALLEIDRLSKILSSYDPNSEFNKWLHTYNVPVKASSELLEVLSLFEKWKNITNGALNPAFEIINQEWMKAFINQKIPSSQDIETAVKKAELSQYSINNDGTITHLTNIPLTINTFVKSYIIDKASKKVMAETGVSNIVMNIGGDIAVYGAQNEEEIAIVNPRETAINDAALSYVNIKNKFIATSGNYRRGKLIDGKWYSHIIDPRNGMPVDHIISATVIADNASDAGALATSFNILSVNESIEIAKQFPTAAYLIIKDNGEQIKSDNWKNFQIEKNIAPHSSTMTTGKDQWDPNYEMTVHLELAQMQGPARRPFVAIWVEDKDKNPLRTLCLWYNKPRWLHDLRAWYAANFNKYNETPGGLTSFTSATRMPGKYEIKWDGKDDKGELVKTGKYNIYIEVAREHGTYQIISQEVKVNNKDAHFELSANTEVASASIEVKKKD